ncbi:MAG: c-type cytochrome domain-containing protein [Planctomycetia bacterium]
MMSTQQSFRLAIAAAAAAVLIGAPAPCSGQQSKPRLANPRLFHLRPCGAPAGTTVDVSIAGDDLDGAEALLFSHPGITARLVSADAPEWMRSAGGPFTVQVGPDVPPGTYEARVRGRLGLSTAWPFEVPDMPVVVEASGNSARDGAMPIEPDTLIDGQMAKNTPRFYRFSAQAGQRFVLAFESRLLNPKGNLLVEVSGPGGRPLASGCATRLRDPVLPLVIEETGAHLVRVIDSELDRFAAEGPYRMVLSTRPYLLGVWPPMAMAATSGSVSLVGHLLPAGTPLVPGGPRRGLEEMPWTITAPSAPDPLGPGEPYSRSIGGFGIDSFRVRLPAPHRSGNAVPVAFAVASPALEAEPNDSADRACTLSPPCDLAGRFDSRGDLDWYTFAAGKGEAFAIEVIAERMGQVADVSLRVEHVFRDPRGMEQVRVVFEQDDPPHAFFNPPFDTVSNDPVGSFTADREGTYRILIRNIAGRTYADSGAMYRLVVRRPAPDWRLLATCLDVLPHVGERHPLGVSSPGIPRLRRGGRFPLIVQLFRQDGFDKGVELAVEGLPAGVSCRPVTIAPGAAQTTLVLEAGPEAVAWQGPIRVVGTVVDGATTARRIAGWATSIANKPTPQEVTLARLVDAMPLEVRPEPAPLAVAVSSAPPANVAIGATIRVPFTVQASAEIKGQVRTELRGLTMLADAFRPPFTLLPEGTTTGAVEFCVPEGVAPGDYQVYMVAQAAVTQVRDPVAVAGATAAREGAERQSEELQAAVEAARPRGGAALSKAVADLEKHRDEEKQIMQRATALLKANAPQPTEVFAVSEPFRLVVTKAAPRAKAAAASRRLLPMLATAAATLAMADDEQPTGKATPVAAGKGIDFNRDVKPILLANCVACHNATENEAGIVLESPQAMLRKGDSGPAIVPGKAAESLAFLVAAHTREPVMPPDDNDRGAKRLTQRELEIVRAWIDAGAKDSAAGPRQIAWQPLPPHIKPVYAAAVSPDGRFAAAGIGNRIVVYDVAAKKPVARLVDPDLPAPPGTARSAAHRDAVRSLAFSPDGTLLASGAMRTVTLWKRSDDAAGGGPAWKVGRRIGGPERIEPFVDRVLALAFSPDGKILAAGGGVPTQGGEVVLVDPASGSTVRRFPAPIVGQAPVLKDVVLCLAFSPDGSLLATGGADRTVAAFTAATGEKVHVFDDHAGRVLGIAWRGDGKMLASVGVDNQCRFWKAGDAWERGQAVGIGARESVGIHPLGTGDIFVVANTDGAVLARAPDEQKNLPKFDGKAVRSQCLAADPAGKVIAVGNADGSLTVWTGSGGRPTVLADPGP